MRRVACAACGKGQAMQIPIAVTFRHMDSNPAVHAWIERLVQSKLERVCDHINRCDVAIERPNKRTRSGSGFRVRLALTVSPGHDVVIRREPGEGTVRDDVYVVLQDAFEAARCRLQKLADQQRGDVKVHPEQVTTGVVRQLFAEHGFLETLTGDAIYFHRNSVLGHNGFSHLRAGALVAFDSEMGEKGPQASFVRIVDRRGIEPVTMPDVDADVLRPKRPRKKITSRSVRKEVRVRS